MVRHWYAAAAAVAAIISSTATSFADVQLNVTVWQQAERGSADYTYPEMNLPEVLAKQNTAVCFTGGGTRAMVAAFGQLQALHQLGLLNKTRYIAGISGGSWATHAYTYYQRGQPGVAANDDEFHCGNVNFPSALTADKLETLSQTCSRAIATKKGVVNPIPAAIAGAGVKSIWEHTLAKVGIPFKGTFAYDAETVADIVSRNPSLNASNFVLLSSTVQEPHPFPVVGTTLLGPYKLSPFSSRRRCPQYQLLEVTPLYIGQAQTSTMTYTPLYPDPTHKLGSLSRSVGGFIEPYAFGAPPINGNTSTTLPAGATSGQLPSAVPAVAFSLSDATAASSFAPGMAFSLVPGVDSLLQLPFQYWSPATPTTPPRTLTAASPPPPPPPPVTHEPFLFADGGDYENIHLIGMLKRRVQRIVLFLNTEQPLHSSSVWDPTTTKPNSKYIEDMFPLFFGVPVEAGDATEKFEQGIALDYTCNAVFNASDFAPLAVAMQAKQDAGEPVVVTTTLTTIRNDHWGVPAGITANITWVYLSRVGLWEQQLPLATQALVVPKNKSAAIDYGSEITSGPYKHFPSYSTDASDWAASKANILAELTGWAVLREADAFRAALG